MRTIELRITNYGITQLRKRKKLRYTILKDEGIILTLTYADRKEIEKIAKEIKTEVEGAP